MTASGLDSDGEALSYDDRLALLERVAGSSQLKRAARLREFLLYVGKQSLKKDCTEIHEQEIGSEVFGRQIGYDTSQDNIVRVNATELRKRIEAYFNTEGAGETLVLEIPRGSYRPIFRRRVAETQPVSSAAERVTVSEEVVATPEPLPASPPQEIVSPPRRYSPAAIALVVLVLGLAATCLVLYRQNENLRKAVYNWEDKPVLTAFWPTFFHSQAETDIILADTSFALLEDITKHPISLSDYLKHDYTSQIHSAEMSADRRADLDLIMSRNNGSVGDFRVAQRILALDAGSPRLHLQFAREYTPESIKHNNVILIGSRKSNPWVDLLKDRLNFTIEYDADKSQSYVKNNDPHAGEQATYVSPPDPYASSGYSIIAYLPNPSHTADVLILAGTNSEATDAAGEFLTSEETLAKFRKKLNTTKFPYFEVLLKTSHLIGTSFSADLVAYRTYPDLR